MNPYQPIDRQNASEEDSEVLETISYDENEKTPQQEAFDEIILSSSLKIKPIQKSDSLQVKMIKNDLLNMDLIFNSITK